MISVVLVIALSSTVVTTAAGWDIIFKRGQYGNAKVRNFLSTQILNIFWRRIFKRTGYNMKKDSERRIKVNFVWSENII